MFVPATLLEFSRVNDAAAATTKKLLKQQILGDYLRELEEDDLRLAVRFAGGRAFASTDQRVLGVSGAIVSDVILNLYKIDPREYHELIIRAGEIGEALSQIVSRANLQNAGGLSLADIFSEFEKLSATGNVQNKRSIVRELLAQCANPREAAYLVKIIFSDLRTRSARRNFTGGSRSGVQHEIS